MDHARPPLRPHPQPQSPQPQSQPQPQPQPQPQAQSQRQEDAQSPFSSCTPSTPTKQNMQQEPSDDSHMSSVQLASSSSLTPSSSALARSSSCLLSAATIRLVSIYRTVNPEFKFIIPRRCLTRPSEGQYNQNWDNRYHDYILYVNDSLDDEHGNQYVVLELLGTGTFGQVVKCRHTRSGDIVAVKVIKNQPAYFNQAWVEINILRMLHRNNHPDHTRHIVKLYSHFVFRGHLCLVFECLSINLYERLKLNKYVGLGLEVIRNFLNQLLQALTVLVRSEVIHCDLKPENILFKSVDAGDLKLKIIDFGSACQLHYAIYNYVQSRFYRSPEVLLGMPRYDSKIDMWSLGCVTAELFLGIPLFPGENEMNMICRIVEMLGDMPDRFLQNCRNTKKFFNGPSARYSPDIGVFQLKSLEQYETENSTTLPEWKRFFEEKKLRDIIMIYPRRSPAPHTEELKMRECLVDLLHGMLKIDPHDRWSPHEAMQHPFLTGEPLPNGQPWVPPTRPRRIPRSRPVLIDAPHDEEHANVDSLYSASAPNFNANGPLTTNSRWAPAGPTPTATNPTSPGSFQPYPPSGAFSSTEADNMHAPPPNAFAPGSYVPQPALSMYASSMHNPLHPHNQLRRYTFGAPSQDPRAFLYQPASVGDPHIHQPQHPLQTQQQLLPHQLAIQSVSDSPTGMMASTPPRAYSTRRLGGALRGSGSRESLTSSLRMSASKESLGMGRESSVNDFSEDPMFAFGSDDEGFSPAPQQQQSLQSSQLPVYPHTASSGIPHGASAALPPPGPRLSQGRPAAAYGNPSTLSSSYGYTYNTYQPTRPLRTVSSAAPAGATVPMQDVQYDGYTAGSFGSTSEDGFAPDLGTSEGALQSQDRKDREQLSNTRKPPRGS